VKEQVTLTKRQLEQAMRDAAICASFAAVHVPAAQKRVYNAAWRLLDTLKITRRKRSRAKLT
jgi:hypothetical protein